MSKAGKTIQGMSVRIVKLPYVKCRQCKERIGLPIWIPDNVKLEYERRKGVKFDLPPCPYCGFKGVYKASEVHFLDLSPTAAEGLGCPEIVISRIRGE